jgi:hypothetical protein
MISKQGNNMKRILILSTLVALLGGCAIVPVGYGYGDNRDGYRERGYDRGEGSYQGYGYRGDRDDRSGYRDHG